MVDGFALNGIDPTFDYVAFLFGPSTRRQSFSATHDYANFAEMKADYARRGTITVNTAHGENTIFANKDINARFRFWHDMAHLAVDAPFTAEGERLAAGYQMSQVRALVGPSDADKARWVALIDCEVNGQTSYFMEHGEFPDNQRAFALAYLEARGVDITAFPRTLKGVSIVY